MGSIKDKQVASTAAFMDYDVMVVDCNAKVEGNMEDATNITVATSATLLTQLHQRYLLNLETNWQEVVRMQA